MSFKPNKIKQAPEIIFTRKIKNVSHPNLHFNNQSI